ncbi:MAG TPA: hypothetical protein PK862_01695, partial [Candidatus Pacearchaeota archaeon]|nr:hypothetical protein [Candidatus Pacearchaeota archaeon]
MSSKIFKIFCFCLCSFGILISSGNVLAAACGSANGQSFYTAPASNLCSSGQASSVITTPTNFIWGCADTSSYLTATVKKIAMSSNGQYQTVSASDGIYTSSNYGGLWIKSLSIGVGSGFGTANLAVSSTGQYQTTIITTSNGRVIYVSSDYGITWSPKITDANISGVFMSSDTGQYQIVVGTVSNYYYFSSDYGNNWQKKTSSDVIKTFVVSSNGKYQIYVAVARDIYYISSDYGQTFVQKSAPNLGSNIEMSRDGQYQVSINASSFYISSDYGQSWKLSINLNPGSIINGSGISSDGKYISFVTYEGGLSSKIYTSSDYGQHWKSTDYISQLNMSFNDIFISSDGKYQLAYSNDKIYISSNYGGSWTQITSISNIQMQPFDNIGVSSNIQYISFYDINSKRTYVSSNYGSSWVAGKLGVGCMANKKIDGSCGTANGSTFSSVPTTNLCSVGTASGVTTNSTTYTWTCAGSSGGTNANCSANRTVNGSCGSSNGQSFYIPPTTNLCNAGNASSVTTNSTQFTWTCSGINGGSTVSCSSNQLTRSRPCLKYGDINQSGAINYYDLILAFEQMETIALNLIDVDGGGSADFNDLVEIQNYVNGTVSTFSVCSKIVNGSCGTANGKTYPYSASSYGSDTQCA